MNFQALWFSVKATVLAYIVNAILSYLTIELGAGPIWSNKLFLQFFKLILVFASYLLAFKVIMSTSKASMEEIVLGAKFTWIGYILIVITGFLLQFSLWAKLITRVDIWVVTLIFIASVYLAYRINLRQLINQSDSGEPSGAA